ncbi:Leucine-rich repeat receptor-like protein kinase family [Quillaja saponaria]|uniref:Leucine-rich repeat receptor-like protein kinase family n=1 Tax=Quillaja saponaria TaxID=32244 RepID=A0AAD7M063_QUISA|nr:Leucine-rich repeat receptor-like protein kinase family [Quillaja saponaria]
MERKMVTSASFLLCTFLLHFNLLHEVTGNEMSEIILEGGIGDGTYNNCPPPPFTSPFENERIERAYHVIQEFKPRITSDPKRFLDTWNGPDVCNYRGFRCDIFPNTKDRAVSGINFNGAAFSGTNFNLSGLLDRLPDLVFFHANSNNFTGTIPKEIIQYKYFYELDMSNNKFCGEFPKEILGAKQLTFIDLRFNKLYGSIPPELFMLDVDVIFINNNCFNQKLPDNFGFTPASYITLANNQFIGPIPKSIGQASETLSEVLLLNNHFSGCLPYEIGFLKNAKVFDASLNELTGPIPQSFACLEKMQFLNLTGNRLYGPVPELVCKLPNLYALSLSNNYFTEVGPECRNLITKKVLDVSMNCIPGFPNQKSKDECATFCSTPKYCPSEISLTIVPCKNYYLSSPNTSDYQPKAAAPSPVTYNALKQPRLS